MPATNETTIDLLNSLLRGELAAVETYRQAEAKFDDLLEAELLKQVTRDHQQVGAQLRDRVTRSGGKAERNSEVWSAFTRVAEEGAMMSGKTAALKALKEGEQHGVSSYEAALKDEGLPPECQNLIRNTLLPRCMQHIYSLNQMIDLQIDLN